MKVLYALLASILSSGIPIFISMSTTLMTFFSCTHDGSVRRSNLCFCFGQKYMSLYRACEEVEMNV